MKPTVAKVRRQVAMPSAGAWQCLTSRAALEVASVASTMAPCTSAGLACCAWLTSPGSSGSVASPMPTLVPTSRKAARRGSAFQGG